MSDLTAVIDLFDSDDLILTLYLFQGYIVHSSGIELCGVLGLRFIIQSNQSPDFLDQRIETFLDEIKVRFFSPFPFSSILVSLV